MARWLTTRQVAEKLNKSPRAFREKIAVKPGFPVASRPDGMHPLWREDEIDEWLERGRDRSHVRRVVHAEQ